MKTSLPTIFTKHSVVVALVTLVATPACVVEEIDSIIAERGMTYYSSSTDEDTEDSSSGLSTGTSTSTDSSSGTSTGTSTTSGPMTTSTTTESSAESESTGTPTPVCGNGILEDDETCDDGNMIPGDGCQECAKDSIVFITSEVYQGFALGGLHGADQRCRNLATKAGLSRPLTFTAWLSTPDVPAANRLQHSDGRYVLVNGLVVAQNWTALTVGPLETTITVDENSQSQDVPAWTGTVEDGQPAPGSEFCDNWEFSGLMKFGGTGLSISADATWSYFGESSCISEAHLYCIEQ